MIENHEISALMRAVSRVTREFVAKESAPLAGRIDALEARLNALPVPKDGEPGRDGAEALSEIAEVFCAGLNNGN